MEPKQGKETEENGEAALNSSQDFLQLIEETPENRQKYLEYVLDVHQSEVNDATFEKGCFYCRDVIKGTRSQFLEHLFNKHFLQLGKVENLVFIDELLKIVEQQIKELVCLYCEKIFRDRKTLKEHMRKKGHKRINPDNTFYDKFFLINYYKARPSASLEAGNVDDRTSPRFQRVHTYRRYKGRDGAEQQRERSVGIDNNDDDSDWSVWETDENTPIVCLFCTDCESSISLIKQHMATAHSFDFDNAILRLNFYQRVKLVNYVRHQVALHRCVNCSESFDSPNALMSHMKAEEHFRIGDARLFNQPEYFFPTVEDDPLLCFLEDAYEDVDQSSSNDDSAIVISEEIKAKLNPDAETFIAENFLKDADY